MTDKNARELAIIDFNIMISVLDDVAKINGQTPFSESGSKPSIENIRTILQTPAPEWKPLYKSQKLMDMVWPITHERGDFLAVGIKLDDLKDLFYAATAPKSEKDE